MASMFEQYEQAIQKQTTTLDSVPSEMTTSGYIQIKMEEEQPILTRQKFGFKPGDKITHMAVSNDYIVIAMANDKLFRMDLKKNDTIEEEISFSRFTQNVKLSSLFLDPLGNHLLLSLAKFRNNPSLDSTQSTIELLYLSKKSNKIRPTTKFRNHEITAVAWNYTNESYTTTGPILFGTSRGLIFETEINLEQDKIFIQPSLEQYWKQLPNYLPLYGNRDEEGLVFDIGKGVNIPITGLEYYRVPNSDRYFVICITPTRLYQFIGNVTKNRDDDKLVLQQIFNLYLNVNERYQEIKSTWKYSRLSTLYTNQNTTSQNKMSPIRTLPKKFAWLTEPGIYYGELDPYSSKMNSDSVLEINELFECNKSSLSQPINFILTEFHAILLYPDCVKMICLLKSPNNTGSDNDLVVFEQNYSSEKLVNITRDVFHANDQLWIFTESNIYRYRINNETRDVWRVFCTHNKFDLAKKYAKLNGRAIYDKVLVKEADYLFNTRHDYIEAAKRYADTLSSSFEEVCLKFLRINEWSALKCYLLCRLNKLKLTDKTQITLIVLWLFEIYLNQLNNRQTSNDSAGVEDDLKQEFEEFLKKPLVIDCIKNNKNTIYELISSHGDKQNLIKLAIINKDYKHVIQQYISENNYTEALKTIKTENKPEYLYQFAAILFEELPHPTVSAMIELKRQLQPIKLLPIFVSCMNSCNNAVHVTETIRYLEYSVYKLGATDRAIHNYLLTLYVKSGNEIKLMQYLATQGQDKTMVNYDIYYTLKLCQENNLTEACVQLSAMLDLWETAVELALSLKLDLAKQVANMPENDNDLKKKLWLMIAKHVVSGTNDIKSAMEFLEQCDLIKIEDVLPFFNDFDTIDHFKDAICTSLQEYSQHIEELKKEMEEASKASEIIRQDIQTCRNHCKIIKTNDVCSICNLTLLTRSFYLFPSCSHKFHADCLVAELTPLLDEKSRTKLSDLNRQLLMLNNKNVGAGQNNLQVPTRAFDTISTVSTSLSARDQLIADIDDLIASECFYCGELMIRDIDKSFIDERDFDKIIKDWA